MASGKRLRVLLADDHETVRAGLKAILSAQPDMSVIAEADNGRSAVSQTRTLRPDVVVMDISMPDGNGLQATEEIHQHCPGVKVVALTRHSDEGYLRQLLRAGVAAYVLKQSRSTELLYAIRAVASGRKYLDPAVADKVIGRFGSPPRSAPGAADRSASPREEEVLRLVAWGYSNKEIAARLNLSVKTVETHKANAMHKLRLQTRIDVVRFAVLQGWLREGG